MENEKTEQEKPQEQQASQAEQPAEQKPDIYEQMKTLSEEEKKLCPNKISEYIQALYTRGLIEKMKDIGVKHVPISLTPSPIPKNLFEKIFFYQIAFNKIYNKLSNDQAFIEKTLEPISSKDNHIQKLLEISKKSISNEKRQKIKLSFFRNDYVLDKDQKFLFLKEFNTNCSNFEFSFTNILLNFFDYYSQKYKKDFSKYKEKNVEIPQNKGNEIEKFTDAIIEAIKLAFPQDYKTSSILFIVNENQNKYDFHLENLRNELYNKHEIRSCKLLLNEVNTKITKDEEGNLLKDGNKISLVYFNSFDKNDFKDEESYKALELIELSKAIKVPDVNTYLSSLKIFQYYLSKPDIIMHYNHNELIINDILRFFGGIYYLPDKSKEERNDLIEKIKASPDNYILKTKEEKTGENLKQIINSIGEGDLPDELVNGIIVEKYNPPEHESVIIKDENSKIEKVISEYGIYGIILMNDNNLVINKSVSFLIKTGIKGESLDILDLPCLIETKIEPNITHKVEVKAEEIQKYLDDLKAAEEEKKKKEEEEKKRLEEEAKKKEEEEKKKEEEKKEEEKKEEEKKEEENKSKENKEEGEVKKEENEENKEEEKKEELNQDEIDSAKLADDLKKFDEEHPKQEVPPDMEYDIDNDYDIDQAEKDTEINNALQASQNLMAEKEKEKNKVVPQQNIANNNANNANNA